MTAGGQEETCGRMANTPPGSLHNKSVGRAGDSVGFFPVSSLRSSDGRGMQGLADRAEAGRIRTAQLKFVLSGFEELTERAQCLKRAVSNSVSRFP